MSETTQATDGNDRGSTHVGLVGVGIMGSSIAKNLLAAGFPVTGFDLDQERLDTLRGQGGSVASSPAQVATAADVVLVSLPTAGAFRAVVAGDDGLAQAGRDGLVVADMSTLPLADKHWGRETLAAAGATLLDCPLSGTGDQAVHGDLIVLVSGDQAAAEPLGPVFDGFSRAHYFLGDFGAGTKAKLVANLLVGIHNVAAAEALVLAKKAGLDLPQMLEVLGDSAATSRMFEVRGPKMVAGDYAGGVRSTVFQKDILAISEFARDLECPTPLFGTSAQAYQAGLAQGHADEDTASVYEVLLRAAGLPGSAG